MRGETWNAGDAKQLLDDGKSIKRVWRGNKIKTGDRSDCSNYRDISLLSHSMKIYERTLERNLEMRVEDKMNKEKRSF